MNDHIIVSFEAVSSVLHDAVQAWVDYIKAETLAVDVRKTPIGDADKVVEICVHHVAVQIRKVYIFCRHTRQTPIVNSIVPPEADPPRADQPWLVRRRLLTGMRE